MDLFRRAKAVVGVHGSGLANQIWCAPHTALVEIVPYSPKDPIHNDVFHKMAYYLDLDYYVVPFNAGDQMYSFTSAERMTVDMVELAAALSRVAEQHRKSTELR